MAFRRTVVIVAGVVLLGVGLSFAPICAEAAPTGSAKPAASSSPAWRDGNGLGLGLGAVGLLGLAGYRRRRRQVRAFRQTS